MINPQCILCNLGVEMESELSQRQVADKYGVHRASVQRHRRHFAAASPDTDAAVDESMAPVVDELLAPFGLTHKGMRVRGATVRDELSGSWVRLVNDGTAPEVYEKIDAVAILNSLDRNDEVVRVVEGDSWFVISINDTQLGKGEGGGTEATLKRVKASVEAAKKRIAELRLVGRDINSLIIIGGGDIIEGCTIYPNQVISNDLTQSEQIEAAVTMILYVIDQLAPLFERVITLATKGNHGENRVNGAKTAPRDNNDTMVFRLAKMATERDDRLKHVEYVICSPEEEAVYMEVPNTPWTLGTTHGDIFGKFVQGQTKMLKAWNWYKNMAVSRNPKRPDVIVTHHFHHEEKADWGSCLWVQTRAQDGGSAYFEQFSGQYSDSGMLSFVMTPSSRYQDEAYL